MKIGILADSHGRIDRVRRALHVFEENGAETLIHCGDVGGVEVLEEFVGRRLWFVWGNTDSPWPAWRPQVESLGLPWPDGPVELTLDGRPSAIYHGHESDFRLAIRSGKYDYLFHGHTHKPEDRREGRTRVLNPGALHRTRHPSVAVLDLEADDLRFYPVD